MLVSCGREIYVMIKTADRAVMTLKEFSDYDLPLGGPVSVGRGLGNFRPVPVKDLPIVRLAKRGGRLDIERYRLECSLSSGQNGLLPHVSLAQLLGCPSSFPQKFYTPFKSVISVISAT